MTHIPHYDHPIEVLRQILLDLDLSRYDDLGRLEVLENDEGDYATLSFLYAVNDTYPISLVCNCKKDSPVFYLLVPIPDGYLDTRQVRDVPISDYHRDGLQKFIGNHKLVSNKKSLLHPWIFDLFQLLGYYPFTVRDSEPIEGLANEPKSFQHIQTFCREMNLQVQEYLGAFYSIPLAPFVNLHLPIAGLPSHPRYEGPEFVPQLDISRLRTDIQDHIKVVRRAQELSEYYLRTLPSP